MLFNLEWLKDYVEIDISVQELADLLTVTGNEVEEIREENGVFLLDINISPNRSDCMNYIGMAREIAATLNKPLILPNTGYTVVSEKSTDNLSIEIDSPGKIHRFAGKVLKNVKISESPDWMKKRLESVGLRPVSDLVDITNYVLLETGHPMHAYDMRFLEGRKLRAREAVAGEKMTTLDGVERALLPGDIVITDAKKAVGLGGVMGGANSEISSSTIEVALEAAWFDPIQIRKTSKRLTLSTDASYRFERTADIEAPLFAIDRCCALIGELMKADILSETIDVYPHKHEDRIIAFRPERARKLVSVNFTEEQLTDIFTRLMFTVQSSDQYRWKVQVPSYRSDLEKEVDLIEEAARIFGYNKVPATLPPFREGGKTPTFNQQLDKKIAGYLVGAGLNQVLNFSFSDLWENEFFGLSGKQSVKITNPIAEDMGYLRSAIMPRLIRNAVMNYNYGVQNIGIFEMGYVFRNSDSGKEVIETNKLGIVLSGKDYPLHWKKKAAEITFFDLKGIIESIPIFDKNEKLVFKKEEAVFLDSEQSAGIYLDGKKVGYLGKISVKVAEVYDVKFPLFIAEIDLDCLASFGWPRFVFSSISRFQPVERDIALLLDENISNAELLSSIKNLKLNVLKKATLFDVYHGGRVPEGKKSVALNLVFLNEKGSFTSEELSSLEEKILKALESGFSAVRISK